jgi:hypothetical protein
LVSYREDGGVALAGPDRLGGGGEVVALRFEFGEEGFDLGSGGVVALGNGGDVSEQGQ